MHIANALSIDNEQLIYGIYRILQDKIYHGCWVYTLITALIPAGSNKDAADALWWLKQSSWKGSGADIDYWSSLNESWFCKRIKCIHRRSDELIKATERKDLLKYQKADTQSMLNRYDKLAKSKL